MNVLAGTAASAVRMSGVRRQQLQFIRFGRPAAAVGTLVVFGIYALFAPAEHVTLVLPLLGLVLAISLVDILALRRWSIDVVARVTLGIDIGLIAVMIALLDEPALLVVPFYAPIAYSALMFGPIETAVYTGLGGVAGVIVGPIINADEMTIFAQLAVFAVTGAILSALSGDARRAQVDLARERARDATALEIAERIRFSTALEDVLKPAVEELGRKTASSRCLLRLSSRSDGSAPIYEWDAPGVAPTEANGPPPPVRRVLESGEPLIVDDTSRADADLRAFAASAGAAALIGYPVVWQEDVIAVLFFTAPEPRNWSKEALPLIARVAPLLAASLAQAELVEQQQTTLALREELIANVSHELRTPLTSTIGFLQTLDRGDLELTGAERQRLFSVARREAERLAVLVEDLLQLALLEHGDVRLEKSEVDLGSLAKRAADGLEVPEAREIVFEDGDVSTEADAGRILQVLQNLLTNSIRHGEGRVRVAFERKNSEARILVSDEGDGVPAEQVPQLFVPFAKTSTRRDSSGLGLAISRRIAEAHGGSLRYRPAQNGVPHAFVLELPA